LAWNYATTDEARQLLLYGMTLPRQFQRQYVMAREVPMERVQAIRNAFDRALQDPDLLADAEKSKLDINPLSGEEAQQRVQQLINMPANVNARLKEIAATKT
jgi:tripartite-type tricarboxylate transporter receptor subunit TctC